MPQAVRNFWLILNVDGRTGIQTGPRAAHGGFDLAVLVREGGAISPTRVYLRGDVDPNGRLVVTAEVQEGGETTHGPYTLVGVDR